MGLLGPAVARHFLHDLIQHCAIDLAALLDRTHQQQARRDLVDPARDTAACLVDLGKNLGIERRIALPVHQRQTVFDIGCDLLHLHRGKVMRCNHALAKLFEPVVLGERLLKFRLAEQQLLQQGVRTELKIAHHPQLFERFET